MIPMKKLTIICTEISAGHILWIYCKCQQLTVTMVVVVVQLLTDSICSKTHMVNAMQRKCKLCFNSNEHSSVLQSQNAGCVSIVMNIPLYSSHKIM